jgi:hypothetical protein
LSNIAAVGNKPPPSANLLGVWVDDGGTAVESCSPPIGWRRIRGELPMVWYRFLADVVVVVHGLFIAFVVFGLLAILVGGALRREWARNFWFRVLHLAAIGIVVVQALLGLVCPLTTLEKYLRTLAGEATYPGAFIGHWVHRIILYEVPQGYFTVWYCLFGAVVAATLFFIPPRWPWRRTSTTGSA